MSFGVVGLALSVVQGISQIGQGKAAQAEANYNATLVEGKAGLIDVQKDIEYGQYQRLKGRTASTSMANIAASGIAPTGSAMAAILSNETQINLDQAIGQFNLEQEKRYTLSEAEQIRRQGKQSASTAKLNAFSTILRGVSDYGIYQRTSVGTKKDTTFDSVVQNNRAPRGISWSDT